MRRRPAVLIATLLALAVPASASAAVGVTFPGTTLDGPSADIRSLDSVDIARDGTGALAFIKREGGVDHVFVARLVDGSWLAPERVDAALSGPASQPVVAASDGGRVVVAFVSTGGIVAVSRPSASQPYGAPQLVAASGSSPDLDLSVNGVAYLTFVSSGVSALDVRAARLERGGTAFTVLTDVLDVAPAANAGGPAGPPRVAVAADGVALAVWEEAGHIYSRRIFEYRLSTSPQDLNLASFEGQSGGAGDRPDVTVEDDSSYAWVVYRQQLGGVSRAIGRRLVGSAFEAPVLFDGGQAPEIPRIAMSGRGVGYAAVGAANGAAFGAVLKDDALNAGVNLGGSGAPSLPAPAVDETGDGLVAYQAADRVLRARLYDYIPATRAITLPGPDVVLSDPALGLTDVERGLHAGGDRVGDLAVAFVQGTGADTRIVVGGFDRAPGTFRTYSSSKWRRGPRPTLKWGTSADLWGVTYEVQIDGVANGQTTATSLTLPNPVGEGVHRWRVVAIDRRGQRQSTVVRTLRVDGRKPKVTFKVTGPRKKGGMVKVAAQVSDATGTKAKASGLKAVRISFGDRSRAVAGRRAIHRYRRSGRFTVKVTATDNVGNVTVSQRRIRIKG